MVERVGPIDQLRSMIKLEKQGESALLPLWFSSSIHVDAQNANQSKFQTRQFLRLNVQVVLLSRFVSFLIVATKVQP